MAGEWIPIDCNLGTKPEVLELVDVTGVPVEAVVYRLIQLWSWAALNTADGTIRATPSRLGAVAGGDEAFWLAVERVGWLSFVNGTVTIAGWDRRFSKTAKSRAIDACRKAGERSVRNLSESVRTKIGLEERRGEEKREDIPAAPVATSDPPAASRSRPQSAISWSADAGWEGITPGDRAEWSVAFPGAVLEQELAKAAAWLRANPQRAGRRNWRRFLVGWLQRCQDKGGTNREPGNRPQTGPPPVDAAKRRYWRSDADRSMTEAEYAAWRRDRSTGGVAAGLAAKLKIAGDT
jgi:hypothetical protein